jgi:hypothetical protein
MTVNAEAVTTPVDPYGVDVLGPAGPLTGAGNGFIVPRSTRQTGLSQGEVP